MFIGITSGFSKLTIPDTSTPVIFGYFTIGVSIFLFYHLTLMVWENKNIALRASWVFALMPSLCLFSSLILREVYPIRINYITFAPF